MKSSKIFYGFWYVVVFKLKWKIAFSDYKFLFEFYMVAHFFLIQPFTIIPRGEVL